MQAAAYPAASVPAASAPAWDNTIGSFVIANVVTEPDPPPVTVNHDPTLTPVVIVNPATGRKVLIAVDVSQC